MQQLLQQAQKMQQDLAEAQRELAAAEVEGQAGGGLVKIALTERDGVVHWHTAPNLQPAEFQK